jgi:hypothetical protein
VTETRPTFAQAIAAAKKYADVLSGVGSNQWTTQAGGNYTEVTNPPSIVADSTLNNRNVYSFGGVNNQLTDSTETCAVGDYRFGLFWLDPTIANSATLFGSSAASGTHSVFYLSATQRLQAFAGTSGPQQAVPLGQWVIVGAWMRSDTRCEIRCNAKTYAAQLGTTVGSTTATGVKIGMRGTSTGPFKGKCAMVGTYDQATWLANGPAYLQAIIDYLSLPANLGPNFLY